MHDERIAKLPKWAQELIENLDKQRLVNQALRWTEPCEPDVPPPDNGLTKGFTFNQHLTTGLGSDERIVRGCSSSTSHCFGSDAGTTSQRPMMLYSTKLLALKGLRATREKQVAKILADIDREIETETAKDNIR